MHISTFREEEASVGKDPEFVGARGYQPESEAKPSKAEQPRTALFPKLSLLSSILTSRTIKRPAWTRGGHQSKPDFS